MKHFALVLLLLAPAAASQTIYKCSVNGRTEYSGSPCYSGSELKRMAPDGGPTPEDRARARMRVQAQMAEQRKKEDDARAAVAHGAVVAEFGTVRRELDNVAQPTSARDNEKELTHDISGWDRKPRGQVRAETEALESARAPPLTGAAWETKRSLTHSISGWDTKSGREQVLEVAAKERERRIIEATTIASCDPGGCVTLDGTRYNRSGSGVIGPNGNACSVAGRRLVC